MAKIKMIVSAVVVSSVVSTSLAFKGKAQGNAYACIDISPTQSECQLQHADVVSNNNGEFSLPKGAISRDALQAADCKNAVPCNNPIRYTIES